MANTVVKDLFIKAGYDPEKEEDIKKVFDQAGKLNGEFGDGINTFVEQFGESVAARKYNWFKGYVIDMNPKKSKAPTHISNSDIGKIVKCVIEVLGGTEADLWEFKAMITLVSAYKTIENGALTYEQKDALVQQAYDSRVEKAEDLRQEAEKKAAAAAEKSAAHKRVKKADAKTLEELGDSVEATPTVGETSVDDILAEFES